MNISKPQPLLALLCVVVAAALPGCKSNGSTELLERELRCQEDRIYKLEDELDDAYFALDASRRENQSLKEEASGGDRGAGGRFLPTPQPRMTQPGVPKVEIPELTVPQIEVPESDAPATSAPSDEAPPFRFVPKETPTPVKPGTLPQLNLPDMEPANPESVEPGGEAPRFEQTSHVEPVLTGDASRVTRLLINRRLTGGWNPNHKHGDEGVFVAFEPRDAENQLIAAPGSVSVAVIDPALTGGAARVGRWDFTLDEAVSHFRTKGIGRGYQFELPWPSKPPVNRDLRLFVRFETADGRRIEADTKITVKLYDGWTQKPADARPNEECAAKPTEPESRLVQSKPAVSKPTPRKPTQTARRPRWSPRR